VRENELKTSKRFNTQLLTLCHYGCIMYLMKLFACVCGICLVPYFADGFVELIAFITTMGLIFPFAMQAVEDYKSIDEI
jgi:hypothetical protein